MSSPQWEEKNWGRVMHVFSSPHAAVSCLEVTAGQQCSRHMHRERINQFMVLEGSIVVEWWDVEWREPLLIGKHIKALTPGKTCCVLDNVWHRFRVIESGRVVEVYWSAPNGKVAVEDIRRFDVGGGFDMEELRREVVEAGLKWPPGGVV